MRMTGIRLCGLKVLPIKSLKQTSSLCSDVLFMDYVIGNRKRRPIAHSLWLIASILFSLFRVVFSIRDDKDNESNNQYSCKNYVQSFRHLLSLLFLRNCIKAEQKYNDSDNKKSNACSIRDLFGKNAAYHTDGKQILGNIHEHFTCFFSSVFMLHDFNYIIKKGR